MRVGCRMQMMSRTVIGIEIGGARGREAASVYRATGIRRFCKSRSCVGHCFRLRGGAARGACRRERALAG